ncbi:MAG: hypothetical protein JWN95_1609 [Frankiales bacterium]|nr:hypothetical protein [Frankiales bacterium]
MLDGGRSLPSAFSGGGWGDINAHGLLIGHNVVEHNLGEGILYEISRDAVIRYNQVYRDGFQAKGWYWGGGITVASSSNVDVYGNRLSGTTGSPGPNRTGPTRRRRPTGSAATTSTTT